MVIPSTGMQPHVLAGTCKRELACKVGPVPPLTATPEVPSMGVTNLCQGAGVCPRHAEGA